MPFLIQKAEYEYYFAPGKTGIAKPPSDTKPTFLKEHPVNLVQEDQDVFGDGSVMIIYTPGHTPGHQSCLVHLSKTGWVLLSGDAVHLQENWDTRRIPYFSTMPAEQKIADAIVDAAHGRSDFLLSRAVVDQSRENAKRQAETRAGLLRIGAV